MFKSIQLFNNKNIQMKNKILLISIISVFYLSFSSSTCNKEDENCHRNIFVDNKSAKDIYILPSWEYPDTTIYHQNVSPKAAGQLKIMASTNDATYLPRRCWEHDFSESRIGKDTLIIYLFDAQIVENVPWDSIRVRNQYLKRFDLSLSDLQKLNWQLVYTH